MNKNFCVLPFLHFIVKLTGDIKPCCMFSINKNEQDIRDWKSLNYNLLNANEIINSEAFNSIRSDMLNNKQIPGCWKCSERERLTNKSMRIHANEKFKNHDTSVKLKYIEISFGNYCNLGCRTCNSWLSSTWYDDDLALNKVYKNRCVGDKIINAPVEYNDEEFKYVEEIKFVGGEPMLNPDFSKFLKNMLKTKDGKTVKLNIFTNCSWFPKTETIDLIKNFENVNIWLSIDAYSSINDYIRHGSSWEVLRKNALKYLDIEKEKTNFVIILTPTINIMNAFYVNELIDWWVDERVSRNLNFNFNLSNIVFTPVFDPYVLSVKNIPNKSFLISKYKSLIGTTSQTSEIYKTLIQALEQEANNDVDIIGFVQFTKDLDKLRNQDFKSTFPELYNEIEKELKKINLSYDEINGKLS
jgi:pyruvate-formate lyase-activating enzyme